MTRRIECGEGWGNCIEIYDTSNEPEANACLIVAAPELLAALRDAQQALAHAIYKLKDDPSFSTSIALKGAEGRARNAIAKAEFVPYSAAALPASGTPADAPEFKDGDFVTWSDPDDALCYRSGTLTGVRYLSGGRARITMNDGWEREVMVCEIAKTQIVADALPDDNKPSGGLRC